MFRRSLCLAIFLSSAATNSFAALIDTRVDTTPGGAAVDGVLGADEYGPGNSYQYLGAGDGFGGTLGAGALYLESDATNLYVGFQPGNNLNDLVFIQLDTRLGGQTDATMDDQADGGRRAASNHSANAIDPYPIGILPDFSIVIGNFGIVTFELTAGNTPGHLNFVDFNGTFTGNAPTFREYAIPLAAIGSAAGLDIDFFAGYTSDDSFLSNESLPASPLLNAGTNPGHDGPSAGYENHNRFRTIPEPATIMLLAFGAAALIRRR